MILAPEQFKLWLPASFDGPWRWDFLDGSCGPSIRPMDHDAIIERNGQFLVYETKRVGVPLKQGPRRLFEAEQRLGVFTHVFLWFDVGEYRVCHACGSIVHLEKHEDTIAQMQVWTPDGHQGPIVPATSTDVRIEAERWYRSANGQSLVRTA